jgi:ubiquinone/menaquinone biosynthesis C-methylase UbiE
LVEARRQLVRDGYDKIGECYLAARQEGGDVALLPELARRLRPGAAVLDAGCGAGVPVMRNLMGVGLSLVGLDLAKTQLSLAQPRIPDASLVQGDLSILPFRDGSFDGLVSYYAVIHVPRSEHEAVFREFARVLHPGGVALLCLGANDHPEDYDPESWLGAPMFWSHFDAETNLRMLRDQGFTVLHHELVTDPMDHGRHLFVLVSR